MLSVARGDRLVASLSCSSVPQLDPDSRTAATLQEVVAAFFSSLAKKIAPLLLNLSADLYNALCPLSSPLYK